MPTVQAVSTTGSIHIVAAALEDLAPGTWRDLVREISSIHGTHLLRWNKMPTLQFLQFSYDGNLDVEDLKITIGHILEARGLDHALRSFVQWDIAYIWTVSVLIAKQVWRADDRWRIEKLLEAAFDGDVAVEWSLPPYKREILLFFRYPPTDETTNIIISTLAE